MAIINNDKINQVSLFAPLLFLAPEEKKPKEIEASKEINVSDDIQTETDDDGQITLSLE